MYLTIKQTSTITGYSSKQIKRFIADGILPVKKMSMRSQVKIWAYDLHSVMEFNQPYLRLKAHQKRMIEEIASVD
jgi:hypothetical protein